MGFAKIIICRQQAKLLQINQEINIATEKIVESTSYGKQNNSYLCANKSCFLTVTWLRVSAQLTYR